LAHLPTTNGAFATGDGIKLVLRADVGAELVDMDQVQIHPTCFVDTKDAHAQTLFLAAEALRGSGGLLLNPRGERFCNELDTRDTVTAKIFEQCKSADGAQCVAYMVLNDAASQEFGEQLLGFYRSKGFVQTFASIAELAANYSPKMPLESLKQTIEKYNAASRGEIKDEFGKTMFPHTFELDKPVHIMKVTPGVHYTMGGLRFSADGEVLRKNADGTSFEPIEGLLAAGEVTGGLHGKNRLAGNSLLECVVFGRRAARKAAAAGAQV
jgi:flavocytochrome c